MKVALLGILLFSPALLWAATPHFLVPVEQYEVLKITGDPEIKGEYYAHLEGYPIMYELTASEPFTLSAQLAQPIDTELEPLSLLIVEVLPNDEGVREVARVATPEVDWSEEKDATLGVTWRVGEEFARELPSGTYWVEVSTPTNLGSYQLRLGNEEVELKYFAAWARVVGVNNFLDRSVFSLVRSTFVLWHILFLMLAAAGWWGWRRFFRHEVA